MKNRITILALALTALCTSACYEDFVKDYSHSATYFASQKPLRTVISGRDMTIEVGAVIGGKRDGWENDWCVFKLDSALLDGTGLEFMPAEYYRLSDESRMTVTKKNIPLMKVTVEFTDEFYADPDALTTKYALPFRIMDSSLDSIITAKNNTVVAVKYVSQYSGTYYVQGQYSELDSEGEPIDTVSYKSVDVSRAFTRAATTIDPNTVFFNGIGGASGPLSSQQLVFTFSTDGTYTITPSSDDEGVSFPFYTSYCKTGPDLFVININYIIDTNVGKYKVEEVYTRRQDPYRDLIFEEW